MIKVSCDLHIHSQHSDGRYRPGRLIKYLKKCGVKLASLTDHDCMWGFFEFLEEGMRHSVRVISGIELTSWLEVGDSGEEVHVLGYGLRWSDELEDTLIRIKTHRDIHQRKIVNKLGEVGIRLDFENLLARAGKDPIIVSHLLWEWVHSHPFRALGLLVTGRLRAWINHFLYDLVGPSGKAYIKPAMRFEDAVRIIRKHEGVAVIAHPLKIKHPAVRKQALESDVDGLEVFYPGQEALSNELIALAKKRNLLITGGTDWHGYFCGAYQGFSLPLEHIQALLKRLDLPPLVY